MGAAAVALDCEEERNLSNHLLREGCIPRILQEIPGIIAPKPEGILHFSRYHRHMNGRYRVCNSCLDEAGVQLVPGSLMPGGEGLVRMSYGTNVDQIREGCKRLKNWLQGL